MCRVMVFFVYLILACCLPYICVSQDPPQIDLNTCNSKDRAQNSSAIIGSVAINQECACRISRSLTQVRLHIQILQISCDVPGSWKLEMKQRGCVVASFPCTTDANYEMSTEVSTETFEGLPGDSDVIVQVVKDLSSDWLVNNSTSINATVTYLFRVYTTPPDHPQVLLYAVECGYSTTFPKCYQPLKLRCGFTEGFCGLTQDSTDTTSLYSVSQSIDWIKYSNLPSSSDPWGSYIFLSNQGANMQEGDTARILTPELNAIGMVCVKFDLQIVGGPVNSSSWGYIHVSIQYGDNSTQTRIVQNISTKTNVGQWSTDYIVTELHHRRERIVFSGVRGSGNPPAAIKLTNIVIGVNGTSTTDLPFWCQEDSNTNSTIVPTHKRVVYCTFDTIEEPLCQVTQTFRVSSMWDRMQGALKNGPQTDHSKTGSYMTVQGGTDINVPTDLFTQVFAVADGLCLSFWYYMYGSQRALLFVSQLAGEQRMFPFVNDKIIAGIPRWQNVKFLLSPRASQVIFTSLKAATNAADFSTVSIDDVEIFKDVKGECTAPVPIGPLATKILFITNNLATIPRELPLNMIEQNTVQGGSDWNPEGLGLSAGGSPRAVLWSYFWVIVLIAFYRGTNQHGLL